MPLNVAGGMRYLVDMDLVLHQDGILGFHMQGAQGEARKKMMITTVRGTRNRSQTDLKIVYILAGLRLLGFLSPSLFLCGSCSSKESARDTWVCDIVIPLRREIPTETGYQCGLLVIPFFRRQMRRVDC